MSANEIHRRKARTDETAGYSSSEAAKDSRDISGPQIGFGPFPGSAGVGYFDYDFVHRRLRRYPFVTMFFPLWVGIAGREQAAPVVRALPLFERAGGLQTSTKITGNQWDAPFAWAPLQMIAVEGLRRYGYTVEADRISREFLSMVLEQYQQHGIIVEKYDAVRRSIAPGGRA
jgi:neutral trehalase